MNSKTTPKTHKLLFMVAFLTCFISAYSQERCGMVEHMKEQMKNPEFARQYKKSQAKFKAQYAKNIANKSASKKMDVIVIPVAVHYPDAIESDRACLEALAQNQIDILNEDYTGTNSDISNWATASTHYPGVNTGATNILFCIATTNHPTGLDPEMVEGGPAVTIGYNFGGGSETDAAWGGYMNFLVKDIGGGLLGFSPLGGSIANGNSVTMNLGAFGSGAGCPNSGIVPSAPYNLGRTVTHELGHFYNLNHSFTFSCTTDDGIADTPNQNAETYGCPTYGSIDACDAGEKVLSMNYMDYVEDACMFMFSAGQTAVAEAYIMSLQSQFKPNVAICTGAPDFTLAATNSSESICNPASTVVYNLTYTTTGGNTDPTVFSASGLPAGATSTFSPTTLNADGTFTLTVNNLNTAAIGAYTISVTGTGIVTNSINVDLIVNGAIPTTPTLTTPTNGTTDTSLIVNLIWTDLSNAITYTVETATNATFTTDLTSDIANAATFTTPTLLGATQYYWRVAATNSCGDSSYSSIYNFTTASITCGPYNSTENNINIPAMGSTNHVITSTINVGTDINITDVNVTINIQHIWAGDMELKLTSPNGTEVLLLPNSECDDGTDDIAVTYDDQAAGPIVCSTTAPSVGGVIQPEEALSLFNGESSLGNWVLTATDGYPSLDGGEFLNFSIEICGTTGLSVNNLNLANSLVLWPNPTKGNINLSFNTTNNENVNIKLYDLSGRLILKQSYANTTGVFKQNIPLANLNTAIYILSIENAGEQINKRIIIE